MPASPVTIRRATLIDLDDAARLFNGYRTFYERDAALEAERAFLRERMANDESVIFLACDGPRAVGFAQLYPSFSSTSMVRSWILNDLFVDPEARGRGVGRALMEHIADFGRASGAARLTLETARDNHPAQRLYKAMGWETSDGFIEFVLDLTK